MNNKFLKKIFIVLICCGLFFNRNTLYPVFVAAFPAAVAFAEAAAPVVSAACGALAAYLVQEKHKSNSYNNSPSKSELSPQVQKFFEQSNKQDILLFVQKRVAQLVPIKNEPNLQQSIGYSTAYSIERHDDTFESAPIATAVAIGTDTPENKVFKSYEVASVWQYIQEHVRITSKPQPTNYALQVAEQEMRKIINEQVFVDYLRSENSHFKAEIEQLLWHVNSTLVTSNSDKVSVEERVKARFEIMNCKLPGIWGHHLQKLLQNIVPYYFNNNGRVKSAETSADVTYYINRYFRDAYSSVKTQKLFLADTRLPDSEKYVKRLNAGFFRKLFSVPKKIYHAALDKPSRPRDGPREFSHHVVQMIKNNSYNHALVQALNACDQGDFVRAYQIAHAHQQESGLILKMVDARYKKFYKTWRPIFDQVFTEAALIDYQQDIHQPDNTPLYTPPEKICDHYPHGIPYPKSEIEECFYCSQEVTSEPESLYTGAQSDEPKSGIKTIEDILGECEPGEKTKGPSKQYIKPGDMDEVNEDFDGLKPTDVVNRGNGLRTGTLPDGRTVVARPTSSPKGDEPGGPTLEIQPEGKTGKIIKIRYRGKK